MPSFKMKKLIFLPLFLFNLSLFAQNATPKPRKDNYLTTLIMVAIAIVFFYLILWRPEQKRRKAAQKQRESLKKGDKITAVGMLGTIASIKENTVVMQTFDGSKIEILKAAITNVEKPQEEKKK